MADADDPGRPEGSEARVSPARPPAAPNRAERRWSIGIRISLARPALGPPPHSDVWIREPTT